MFKLYSCDDILSRNALLGLPYQVSLSKTLFSEKFCHFFSKNLEEIFIKKTGIKLSSKIGIIGPNRDDSPPLYEQGIISRLNPVLWILPEYHDDISFCWKSKTGKIIKPTDENFDEADLECWIEGLKPNEYWKEVATEKKDHPFKVGKISYQLKVFGFGTDTVLRVYPKDKIEFDLFTAKIGETINEYNEASEKNNRDIGVVHNVKFEKEDELLNVFIDTGSAGIEIVKKILKVLAKFKSIDRIEVDI